MKLRAWIIAVVAALSGCDNAPPAVEGAPPALRRITEQHYRNVIADVFGPQIAVAGRFDTLTRVGGLQSSSAREATISPTGFEQFSRLARAIAAQVVAPDNRASLVPCDLDDAFGEKCAGPFLIDVATLLFRRAPREDERQFHLSIARDAYAQTGSSAMAYTAALEAMLVSPQFLFIQETTEPDPAKPGTARLTADARAARLAQLLWNSSPDRVLIGAAAAGELATLAGLERQIQRMMKAAHFERGMRAFFADMLRFDAFETLEKDSQIYPAFSLAVAEDAREQTLRTLVDVLLTEQADYRDIFVTRTLPLSQPLARIYRLPLPAPQGWHRVTLPEGDPRIGIQSQIGFVALHAHEGRSSPTLRGRAVREALLCQAVPDPPGDVDFSQFNDPNSPVATARERLAIHSTNPSCAGCHKLTDPIGLALENFDGVGAWRTHENGTPIDVTGALDGVAFTDPAGFARALQNHPGAPACVVSRLYSYALGREPLATDRDMLDYLNGRFAAAEFRFATLIREIAMSDAFFAVKAP